MRSPFVTAPLVALVAIACTVPVAARLDEPDANEVVGALNASGIAASKERDAEHEGRWLVTVGKNDASGASETLQRRGLPRQHSPGVLEALGEDAILSSPVAEHARWSAGTAAELERSLQGVANVLSVRVHLAVPVAPTFLTGADERVEPTASVLLRYAGIPPPLPPTDVQRLVAGAVPGLLPRSVEVVMRAESAPPHTQAPALARFGPLTVPRRAAAPLRLAMVVAATACLAAVGLALVLWLRLRRAQALWAEAEAARSPASTKS